MRRIRIDFAIAMVVAFAVGALVNFGGGKVIDSMEVKSEEMVYSDTLIGAAPTENVPVVSSIAEMMEEERFTFHLYYHTTDLGASAYYDGTVYDVCELPSGELVVIDDYFMHIDIERPEDSWMSTDYYQIMPIGQVVHEPLAEELISEFAENGYTITDTSFYVDMRGDFEEFDREEWEGKIEGYSFLAGFIVFLIIRYIMIASGIFPPVFPLRFLKKWKRYVVYYGILYYGDSVKEILRFRKQGNYEEAAGEFSRLTGATLEESRAAMNNWNELYGEGIVKAAH